MVALPVAGETESVAASAADTNAKRKTTRSVAAVASFFETE